MHKLIFLDKPAKCGLGLFFCGILAYVYSCTTLCLNDCVCQTNYKTVQLFPTNMSF